MNNKQYLLISNPNGLCIFKNYPIHKQFQVIYEVPGYSYNLVTWEYSVHDTMVKYIKSKVENGEL